MEMDNATENTRLASSAQCHSSPDELNLALNADCKKSSHWEAFIEKEGEDEEDVETNAGSAPQSTYEGMDEKGVFVTTYRSAFESERKQMWKNKRKLHQDRSNWNKFTKYGEDAGEDFSNAKVNERITDNQFDWKKRTRPLPSKGGARELCFKSHGDRRVMGSCESSPRHGQFNGRRFDAGEEGKLWKQAGRSQSRTSSAVATSGEKSTTSHSTNSSCQAVSTTTASKWSGFLTERNEEEDSNDGSDDGGYHFTTKSVQELDRNLSAHHSVTNKWSTFVGEKDSDDSEEFNVDEGSYNAIHFDRENLCSSSIERLGHNGSSDVHQGTRLLGNTVPNSCVDSTQSLPFLSMRKGDDSFYSKSKYSNSRGETRAQGELLCGESKASLFQIGEGGDDTEAWDWDL